VAQALANKEDNKQCFHTDLSSTLDEDNEKSWQLLCYLPESFVDGSRMKLESLAHWITPEAIALLPLIFGWLLFRQWMKAIESQEKEAFERDLHAFQVAALFIFLACFGLYVVARAAFSAADGWKEQTFVGFIWALACLLSGATVGFLFAIPKVRQTMAHHRVGLNTMRQIKGTRRLLTPISSRCQLVD
jgi:hypothetical protein